MKLLNYKFYSYKESQEMKKLKLVKNNNMTSEQHFRAMLGTYKNEFSEGRDRETDTI